MSWLRSVLTLFGAPARKAETHQAPSGTASTLLDTVASPGTPAPPPAAAPAPPGPIWSVATSAPRAIARPCVRSLVSANGGILYADKRGRLVAAAGRREPGHIAVASVIFDQRPDVIFLLPLTDPKARIGMDSDDLHATVLSYRAVTTKRPDVFQLRHPHRPFFVCAAPGAPGEPIDVSVNRREPGGWEELRRDEDISVMVPGLVWRWLEAIGRALDGPFLDWVMDEDAATLAACGGAVLRILDTASLAEVGYAAATQPEVGERLRAILPDDPWVEQALPELGRWLADRAPVAKRVIDPSLDFLAMDYVYWLGTWSIASIVTTLARTRVEPRRMLAVLGTARNEGVYFLEWIAHYRALGAEHFFIYSNDNNDGSDALLSALADAGEITWIDNRFAPKVDGQHKAYSHCLSFMPQVLDYRWTLIVDLDEFVILDTRRYRTLTELLAERESEGATAVAFSWRMFTFGEDPRWSRTPLIERCTLRTTGENSEVKTAFRTRNFIASYPHDPVAAYGVPVTFLNAVGGLHHWPGRAGPPSNGTPLYEGGWINHYYFKSVDEWLWKTSRNRGGFEIIHELKVKPEAVLPILQSFVIDKPVDAQAMNHREAVEAQLRRITALPGVAAARDEVERTFNAAVAKLRSQALAMVQSQAAHDPQAAERLTSLLSDASQAVA